MMTQYHEPALVGEVLHYLISQPDGVYVDGTVGGGGHAEAILTQISSRGKLFGMDLDCEAITFARQRLERFGDQVTLLHENYANTTRALQSVGIEAVNGFLLDLGVSMHQLKSEQRGFSFQSDEKIDMRMDRNQILDGWTVVNRYNEIQLKELLQKYGEERNAGRITRKILQERLRTPINSTAQLSAVVQSAVGSRFLIKSLARVFQAIRIEVNRELENLTKALQQSLDYLLPGGRIVVISYHSLEDRIVKEFLREGSRTFTPSLNKFEPDIPRKATLAVLTKKPVTASGAEVTRNPQSRSAKLRAAERL
jgi:16S rRNA (cytosine1402-N4)-methyltransferase